MNIINRLATNPFTPAIVVAIALGIFNFWISNAEYNLISTTDLGERQIELDAFLLHNWVRLFMWGSISGILLWTGFVRKNHERKDKFMVSVLNDLPDPVFVKDDQHRLIMVNDACCKLFNLSRTDILNNTLAEYANPEEMSGFYADDKHVLDTRETLVKEENLTLGGVSRVILTTKKFYQDSKGDRFVIGSTRDITAKKNAEQRVVDAKLEAEKAYKSKSDFLSSMSHELRTPMNSVMGFAQLIDLDPDISKDTKESANQILRSSRMLLRLINQVLDLAKIDSDSVPMNLEAVNLKDTLVECIHLVRFAALEKDVKITCNIGSSDASVLADVTMLKQVWLNLMTNAIKYNVAGGTLTIDVAAPNGITMIKFSDTGIGVDSKNLDKIFLPFERAGLENSSIEGTGIGLNIVKQLVERMGGSITVSSSKAEHNRGSCFTVSLPTSKSEKPKAVQQQDLVFELTEEIRVLYIEDNDANLLVMSKILAMRKNITLVTASTGRVGVTKALAEPFDIILIDIGLPDINGFEVRRILKNSLMATNTPMVAVTADVFVESKDTSEFKFFGYITKPFMIGDIFTMIEKMYKHNKTRFVDNVHKNTNQT